MSAGIIASRYARALLKLVDQTGGGDLVVRQVEVLQDALGKVPELKRAVDDRKSVSPDQKIALFETVLSSSGGMSAGDRFPVQGAERREPVDMPPEGTMAPELRNFIGLLAKNGRLGDSRLIFNSFISLYYKSRGIIRGRLVLPSEDSGQDLADKLTGLVESRTGKKLLLRTEIDESLIGGFLLEVEDQLLDASVSHQLDMIKRQFIERNRRIV